MNPKVWKYAVLALIIPVIAGCGNQVKEVPKTVAEINGQKISASELLEESYRKAGKQVLTGMIERQILIQWAKDDGVPVDDKQLTALIDIEKEIGSYDQQAEIYGEKQVKEEMKAVQAMINIVKKSGKITDKELKEGYERYKKGLFEHGDQKQIEAVLGQDKSKLDTLVTDLKGGMKLYEAGIKNGLIFAGQPSPRRIWIDVDSKGEAPEIMSALKATKAGEVSEPLKLGGAQGPSQYIVFRVIAERPKASKTFDEAKSTLEAMLCRDYFMGNPDMQKQFIEKKKSAKITITDKNLEDAAYGFKYAQETPQAALPMMPPQK